MFSPCPPAASPTDSGARTVFIAGHAALLGVYAMLWESMPARSRRDCAVLLLGGYYAMTNGVLAAAASAVLDPPVRGTGLALLGASVSLSRLAASVLFGWTWSRYSPTVALGGFRDHALFNRDCARPVVAATAGKADGMKADCRNVIFTVVCLVAVALPVANWSLRHSSAPAPAALDRAVFDRLPPGERGILFRSTVADASFGKVAFVPLEHPDGPWSVSDISCDCVYFQSGRGVCEAIEGSLIPPYVYFMFDERFTIGAKRPLGGVPSRARISPDDGRAALTVFQSGDLYAQSGF